MMYLLYKTIYILGRGAQPIWEDEPSSIRDTILAITIFAMIIVVSEWINPSDKKK